MSRRRSGSAVHTERRRTLRCAIYTRKSSEEGLEQSFNSLDAQRDACEAFIASQKHEGWVALPDKYDDGGFSGGSMDRPALQRLLEGVSNGSIDVVVVYKVDRLSRSLSDFARLTELFDKHGTSFVSVTQQFNTSTSMGRLTLNVLLSFAQFEREVAGERIRDKIALSKRRGMWMGGLPPLVVDSERAVATIAAALRKDPERTLAAVRAADDRVGEAMLDVPLESRLKDAERAELPWQFCFVLGGGWRRAKDVADRARVAGADIVLAAVALQQLNSFDARTGVEPILSLCAAVATVRSKWNLRFRDPCARKNSHRAVAGLHNQLKSEISDIMGGPLC